MWSAAVIEKSSEKISSNSEKKEENIVCKPSQLPIYTSLIDRLLRLKISYFALLIQHRFFILFFSEAKLPHANRKPSALATTIEEGVRVVRVEIEKATEQYEMQRAKIDRHYVQFLHDTQRKQLSSS